ncbi:hypothetical protein NE857_00185 [Nocardiopsis exhalans]|uniref:Uncharacterized protein n=1 Tax=Nocardiopsis exhalans TaxID=163604 RepID=A0ABY5DAM8_9ACTN|nr:hypothetical protein [Nocardiopsis exhalans]USY20141.1 hypothetical protein NE857_00185 [Nocardiopsis exhalans]
MTFPCIDDADAIIPQPAQRLPELRQAVATVAPYLLSEFFEEMQSAFTRAGEEDSVAAIRMFYRKWAVTVTIERRPATAHQLREAEQAVNDKDPRVRDEAIRTTGEIVRAAHREVEGV